MNKILLVTLVAILLTNNILLVRGQTVFSADEYGGSYVTKPGDYANYTISKFYNPENIFIGAIFMPNGSLLLYNYSLGLKISEQVINITQSANGQSEAFIRETVSNAGEQDISGITNRSTSLSEAFDNTTALNSYLNALTRLTSQSSINVNYTYTIAGNYYTLNLYQNLTTFDFHANVTYNWRTGWLTTDHAIIVLKNGSIAGEILLTRINQSGDLDFVSILNSNSLLILLSGGGILVIVILSTYYFRSKSKDEKGGEMNLHSNNKGFSKFKKNKRQTNIVHPEKSIKMIEDIIKENEE